MPNVVGVKEVFRCPECHKNNLLASANQKLFNCKDCNYTGKRWRFTQQELVLL